MFHRILVPLDGSERAEQAIPIAARLARKTASSLLFLRVVPFPVEYGITRIQPVSFVSGGMDAEQEEATDYLKGIITRDELEGIGVTTEVVSGLVAPTILAMARTRSVDLIVMCSHGETGFKRWVLGSIAQKIARSSPVPVLVLEAGGPVPSGIHPDPTQPFRVLVALDGSPLAEAALLPAAHLAVALAAPGQATLHLVRVETMSATYGKMRSHAYIDPVLVGQEERQHAKEYLTSIVHRLSTELADLRLTFTCSVVVDADVAPALQRIAEYGSDTVGSSDLIALATHGRSGLLHLAMGSVTERLLGLTKLPLLIVRPRCARKEAETEPFEEQAFMGTGLL